MNFDVNNPNDRAACIAGQAGFIGHDCPLLTMDERIQLGRAIQEMFPELDYKALWKHLLFLPIPERKRIRARAVQMVQAATFGKFV